MLEIDNIDYYTMAEARSVGHLPMDMWLARIPRSKGIAFVFSLFQAASLSMKVIPANNLASKSMHI